MRNILLIVALALPALTSGPASATTIERHFQKSFDVTPGAILDLNHGDGDVTIEPWNQSRIDVTVDYKTSVTGFFAMAPDFTVDFDQKGDRVSVTGRSTGVSGIIVNAHRTRYTYLIKAPAWIEIRTNGDDGDVEIEGWRANLDLTLDDGTLSVSQVDAGSVSIRIQDGQATLEGISGTLDVQCDDGIVQILDSRIASGSIRIADGDLTIKQSEGDFRIRMDDGSATISGLRSRRLDIRGEDGDTRVGLLPVTNPDVSIIMDDGDIDLSVPARLSAAFEALADDGSISVRLTGASDLRKERHRISGILGDGNGHIQLETADGSIALH